VWLDRSGMLIASDGIEQITPLTDVLFLLN